jgi:transposase
MPIPKPPYPAEFRRRMVELVQAGRTPAQLAREFDCSARSISTWVAQAAADNGKPVRGKDVLTSAEREELARLRRENKQFKRERDTLAKVRAWFSGNGDKASIEASGLWTRGRSTSVFE